MSKTIELIDKYRIEQSCDGEHNPPSYIWEDNTGEIVRRRDCKHYRPYKIYGCENDSGMAQVQPDDYCSRAEKR